MRYIVTALLSEAKPIIKYLKLKKLENRYFNIYQNKDTKLIISGIGKINSATAVGYLQPQGSIINIGICGSGYDIDDIGKLYSIKKIVDQNSQKVIHLQQDGANLYCVQKPQNLPQKFKNTLIDMESYGFYKASKKFLPQKNIRVYKIVSDKISDKILTPKEIEELIYPQLEYIL